LDFAEPRFQSCTFLCSSCHHRSRPLCMTGFQKSSSLDDCPQFPAGNTKSRSLLWDPCIAVDFQHWHSRSKEETSATGPTLAPRSGELKERLKIGSFEILPKQLCSFAAARFLENSSTGIRLPLPWNSRNWFDVRLNHLFVKHTTVAY
jgi:hypothetical protein